MDLFRFREKYTPQTACEPSQRANVVIKCGVVVFIGPYANEWEDYSIYFGDGLDISRNWAATHAFVF